MKKIIVLILLVSFCIKKETIPIVVLPDEVKEKIGEFEDIMRIVDSRVYNETNFRDVKSSFSDIANAREWYENASILLFEGNCSYEQISFFQNSPTVDTKDAVSEIENVSFFLSSLDVEPPYMPENNYTQYKVSKEKFLKYLGALSISGENITHKLERAGRLIDLMSKGIEVGIDICFKKFINDSEKSVEIFSYPPEVLNETYDLILASDMKEVGIALDEMIDDFSGSKRKEMLQHISDLKGCDKVNCKEKVDDVYSLILTSLEELELDDLNKEYASSWGILEDVHRSFKSRENPLLSR